MIAVYVFQSVYYTQLRNTFSITVVEALRCSPDTLKLRLRKGNTTISICIVLFIAVYAIYQLNGRMSVIVAIKGSDCKTN